MAPMNRADIVSLGKIIQNQKFSRHAAIPHTRKDLPVAWVPLEALS